ncbi:oxygenase MpaB family protein [Streptomyces sp. NPDC017056]|uniref:oxygenase MpaB family protein n=1 Tax=Streptomyces sp. NPDC017056 TaxID=3364973 RepID=UPI0037938255
MTAASGLPARSVVPAVTARPGRPAVQPLGPDAVAWRIGGDRRLLLLSGYLLLLQGAHPGIGAATREHPNPVGAGPWQRLDQRMTSVFTLIFGGPQAFGEADRLRESHKTIKGVDAQGKRYHALNPEAYWWVHATLYRALVLSQQWFGRPLSPAAQQRLYQEWRQLGLILGLREHHMPPTLDGFDAYVATMVDERLGDNETVRDLLGIVNVSALPPPGWWRLPRRDWQRLCRTAEPLAYALVVGFMPAPLRDRLGLRWTRADERRLRRFAAVVRTAAPLVPQRWRLHPVAYRFKRSKRP